MLLTLLMLFVSLIGIFIVDFQTMIFLFFFYIVGVSITSITNNKNKLIVLDIYKVLYIIGSVYMLLCYLYMEFHDYDFLLAVDIPYAFLPNTQKYMENSNLYYALLDIWSNYYLFVRFEPGYFSYSTLFGFLGEFFRANFYVSQQIATLFIYPLIGVFVFKIMIKNNFKAKKAFKYSLIISICTIILFYSSQALRDIHIALLYLMTIYLTFKDRFDILNLAKIILLILITITFRVESGLFLFVLIPTYFLITLHNRKQRNTVIFVSLFILIGLLSFSLAYYNQINSVFEANQENYVEGITEGSGVISSLQKVPIAGDFASIIYNGVQPLPFWSHNFWDGNNPLGAEVYNIMNFPKSISSFFNWFVIVYILFWLFSKGLRRKTKGYISKPLQYQLWIGLVFLYMQSAVIAQRRLMAYYCIFYILFFIIYNHIGAKDKKQITITAIFSFVALQIIGLIYLS